MEHVDGNAMDMVMMFSVVERRFFFRLYVGAGFVLIRRTITVSDDDDLFINFIRASFIDKTNYVISGKNVEINWEIVN